MERRPVRIPIGWLAGIAGLAVALSPGLASAQNALGGNNLQRDFNRYGGGSFQRAGIGSNAINNAIIYGNAPNGFSFQGRRGFGNPYEFQGRLGSDQLSRFERDSYFSRAPSFGVNAAQIVNYQRSLSTGGRGAPGIGGSLAVPRNPYTAPQGLSPSLGYKTATSPYKPAQTTLSASGGLFGVDPFGRTRSGMQRDVGLTELDPGSGIRKVTPGGLGGERNLMRDLSSQLSSGLTRQAPATNQGLMDSPIGNMERPAGSTGSGSPRGLGVPVPGDTSGQGGEPGSVFGPGVRTGLNSALKAGKGYDKAVLAQARNAEGWRQQQIAAGLTGVQVRTEMPKALQQQPANTGLVPNAPMGPGSPGLPGRPPVGGSPTPGELGDMPTLPGTVPGPGAGPDGTPPPLGAQRIDTSAAPRTAYEQLRDRMTRRSEETREARADGSDLLSYTLGQREAGGLTGLNERDVLGMSRSPFSNPGSQGRSGSELTTLPGMQRDNLPEWERRVQDIRERLRQQLQVDSTKSYLAALRENQEEIKVGGLEVPNYLRPKTGPTVNLWGKTDRPLPGFTPGVPEAKVSKGPQHGLKLDTTTMRLIRESGGKIETYVNMGAPATDRFKDYMSIGQSALREGRYFDAEELFARAMNEPSADITAMVARTHAQIGAGLFVSAGSNLVKTFTEYPETAAPLYAAELLPREARLVALMDQLRTYGKEDNDLARNAGLILAYIGYQRGDQAAVKDGLDTMARVGRLQFEKAAPGADRDILEDEGRLVEFLRGVWQTP